jgi:hypothetical protein
MVKTSLGQPEVPTFGRPEAELQAEHRLLPSAREQGVPLAQHPCELSQLKKKLFFFFAINP